MADRKSELEEKRRKLAEIKKSREERAKQASIGTAAAASSSSTSATATSAADEIKDIDALVNSLVGDVKPASPAATLPTATTQETKSASVSEKAAESPTPGAAAAPAGKTEAVQLVTVNLAPIDIPPRELVTYSKETQTDYVREFEEEEDDDDEYEGDKNGKGKGKKDRKGSVNDIDSEDDTNAAEDGSVEEEPKEPEKIPEYSPEERKKILNSEDFQDFFDLSSKLMERALNEPYDILIDYANVDLDNSTKKGSIQRICRFYDEKKVANRVVTDIAWHPKHSELLLASYNASPTAGINEAAGLALVWNTHLVDRPEYTLYAQAPVLSCTFSPYHPRLAIGGTYSGQIVIWDLREKSQPVLKTPMTGVGHTHPIYHLELIGTQNANNLVSVSTDGLFCTWSLDMLAKPQEQMELTRISQSKAEELAVTTFSFPDKDTTVFLAGTEEGTIYQGFRYDRAGSKAGINQNDTYKGHFGPVTGISIHPSVGAIDFSDLFLTSACDWTVKLWRSRSAAEPSVAPTVIHPLHSCEDFTDYVFDAQWSPTHPALFATVDGTGRHCLWNLNIETEVPISVTTVSDSVTKHALNKVRWDLEGKRTAVGGSDGAVSVYDIGEFATPKPDEWSRFQKTLSELALANRSRNDFLQKASTAPSASMDL